MNARIQTAPVLLALQVDTQQNLTHHISFSRVHSQVVQAQYGDSIAARD